VRERGEVHLRDVEAEFSHGTVTNYWGGSSRATSALLEAMHYKGWLRVARREGGIRIYAVQRPGEVPSIALARAWRALSPAAKRGTGLPVRPGTPPSRRTRSGCSRRSTRWCGTARRFERLWGWAYRFEAYTPVSRRERGYYALPLLWRDRAIGWGNVTMRGGHPHASFGYVAGRAPRDRAFAIALDAELARMHRFLAGDEPAPSVSARSAPSPPRLYRN
jgi:hypothetical protein